MPPYFDLHIHLQPQLHFLFDKPYSHYHLALKIYMIATPKVKFHTWSDKNTCISPPFLRIDITGKMRTAPYGE